MNNRTFGSWLVRLCGSAALCLSLMAPGCPFKNSFLPTLFFIMIPVDPPSQNSPPVPAVPYKALLVRQSNCSVTRLVFDENNRLLSSYPNYQDYLHQALRLSSTPDQFKNGCKDSTTGIASEFGAFLGKLNSGNYAIATIAAHGVQITIATPNFAIASTSLIATNPALQPNSMATADLNGDGIADLVIASSAASFNNPMGTLTVLLGKGDGTFQAPQTITLPFNAQGVTIDDLNADGKLDVVAVGYTDVNANASHLAILLGHGDGSFAAPVLGPANVTGNAVLTADFNGDGKKDIATSDGYILLGNGDGTFNVPFPVQFVTAFIGIAAGDFNHDGHTDLAITTNGQHGTVDIYSGQGDGQFTRSASYATIYGAQSISTMDLDGDGNIDLFVGAHSGGLFTADVSTGGEFHALLGRGDGSFAAPKVIIPTENLTAAPSSFAFDVADLTGDQKPDLVLVDSDNNGAYLSVLAGNGDITFTPKAQTRISGYTGATPFIASPIVIADFNHDGKNDVAFAATLAGASVIAVALGNGDGTFQAPVAYPTAAPVSALVAADLNGDGKPDLTFVTDASGSPPSAQTALFVMLNNGDGTFAGAVQIDAKPYELFLAVADLNGDGKRDLVVTAPGNVYSSIGGSTNLYLGKGDGTFDAPVALNGGAYPGPIALADINNDGKMDVVIAASASQSAGAVRVLLGNGSGSFQSPRDTAAGFVVASSIAVGDVSKDGKADVVITECCGNTSTWMLQGKGDGTFAGVGTFPLGFSANNARLIDLNGDGFPELLLAANQYAIQVFANSGNSQAIGTSTTTTLSPSALSIGAGQPLTLTATVQASSGATTPAGSVTFFDGSTSIGTVTLEATGKAALTTSSLAQGNHQLMATYGGSPAFATSGSSIVSVTVGAALKPTTTTLSASASSVEAGQPITFTATVSGSASPAGTVTFSDGTTVLGSAALDAHGHATISTSALAGGTHSITALFSGLGFESSTSSAVAITVTAAAGSGGGGGVFDEWILAALATAWLLRLRCRASPGALTRRTSLLKESRRDLP